MMAGFLLKVSIWLGDYSVIRGAERASVSGIGIRD